jgi:hypothetical protein
MSDVDDIDDDLLCGTLVSDVEQDGKKSESESKYSMGRVNKCSRLSKAVEFLGVIGYFSRT